MRQTIGPSASRGPIVFYNTYEPVTSILRDLPPALVRRGHTVEIIVSKVPYRTRAVSLETALGGDVSVRRVGLGGSEPVRTRQQKLLAMTLYALQATVNSVLNGASLRIFLTQPPFFSLLGAFLKRVRGDRYVCVLMDLYPDVLIANDLLSVKGRVARTLDFVASLALRSADAVVVIGRDMRTKVIAKGVDPRRVHYIPNWAADDDVYPVSHSDNSLRSELGFAVDDFVVLYSGNMGVSHRFDDLLQASLSMRNDERTKFVFVGGGARLPEIEAFRTAHGLKNVFTFGYQPSDRLAESLSMGDLHFVSLRQGFDGLVVPSKVFGSMAVGRPILFQGAAESEVASMLAEHEAGTCVEPGDPEALASVIRAYAADREKGEAEGRSARSAYSSQFAADIGLSRYLDVIEGVIRIHPAV